MRSKCKGVNLPMNCTTTLPDAYLLESPDATYVFDRVNGEGLIHPAVGHDLDCWESSHCDKCEMHAVDCPCVACAESKIEWYERAGLRFDVVQHWDMVEADLHWAERWDKRFWDNECADPYWAGIWAERFKMMEESETSLFEQELERITQDTASGFEDHTRPVVEQDTSEPLRSVLNRDGGGTLLYAGKVNSIHGEPGSGKTWLAVITAISAMAQGLRVLWWDHEDKPATLAIRAQLLGGLDVFDPDKLRYITPSLIEDKDAMNAANAWLVGNGQPGLVVIDSAESSGAPSDGKPIAEWYTNYIIPWQDSGATVLILDHVPKAREDRPRGPIGSTHKLSRLDGVGLIISGTPWTKKRNGKMFLKVDKDRNGDVGPQGSTAAVVVGTYKGGAFKVELEAPVVQATEDVTGPMLAALAEKADIGVMGKRGYRTLLKGAHGPNDTAIEELVNMGFVAKTLRGQGYHYTNYG